jgi:phosphohistidine phosphatase SixA
MTRPAVATMGALILTITLIGCLSPRQEPLVVFLVRHAEKTDLGEDPELSAAGHERSVALAAALRNSEIEYVHSSDYIRTRDTAAPMATDHGLEVELYDPRDLPALVERLRGSGGRHLVVGHSNTTPSMVELLGGSPGSPIDEKAEYDRLYIVTIGGDGVVSSVMLRYGSAYQSG